MAKPDTRSSADFIVPLQMNGLRGRMLRLPAPAGKSREILLLYGHHSTIERWWAIAQVLNHYGAVTVPDMPGFGGMQSFYKIGEKPSLDSLADYLAAVIKLKYARKRVTIVAMSFGFAVATRMLQRSPDLAKRVDLLVSVAGFSHVEDFNRPRARMLLYRCLSWLMSTRLASFCFRLGLRPFVLRWAYTKTNHPKYRYLKAEEQAAALRAEYELWHRNDIRTHFYTLHEMTKIDNCGKYVKLPVWHVAVKGDHFFNQHAVEQHMRVIFADFHSATTTLPVHAPTMLTDKREAAAYIPPKIRRQLL